MSDFQMSAFELSSPMFGMLEDELKALDSQSLLRRRRTLETPCAPAMRVDGVALTGFCSNDYLGLAAHPEIITALQQGASLYGAGSGASHLISGHSRAHALLEDALAETMAGYIPQPRALYFCTGYMANLAILSGLSAGLSATKPGQTEIFSESLNHASIIDAARLSRAQVRVYPHGDLATLARMLAASEAKQKIVVTDSVFSMDGNLAELPQILALCEQHQAWLVIDDAHGFGVLGEHGSGVLEHFRLSSPNLIYMGTLGKAAGVGGAFVAAHQTVIEFLLQKARPYIYTTAAPPAIAHALLRSLQIIRSEEGAQRRRHLRALIAQFTQNLQLEHWVLAKSETAIQPVIIGSNDAAMQAAGNLYQQGFWVPAIRPPTVPTGTARLRVTLSAAHQCSEVEALIEAMQKLEFAQFAQFAQTEDDPSIRPVQQTPQPFEQISL